MGQKPLRWENHPEHPEMRGRGLSTHTDVCVCVCVCRQGPAGDLLPMSPHDLFTVPLSNLFLHTHRRMIFSISVIRQNLQMWLFFTQDRTSRRKWRLVQGEHICHPIAHCSSILFSSPFLCSLCPFLILALSPVPVSASHPYSPILTLPPPSPYILHCLDQ